MPPTYFRRPDILADPALKEGHAVIEASAGTGKTFTLEHLVLDLIITGAAKVEEILVVTFTDAATRELRERVRELIRKVSDDTGAQAGADPSGCWTVDEATRDRLREALFRFDGASISTIHGFCQRVLGEQAFLGGRLFEEKQADGSELFGLAFREEARLALVEEGEVGGELRRWVEEGGSLPGLQGLLHRCHREGCPERCPVTPTWDPEGFREAAGGIPSLEELKAAGPEVCQKKFVASYDKHIDALFDALEAIGRAPSHQDAVALFKEWATLKRGLDGQRPRIENLRRLAEVGTAPEVLRRLVSRLDALEARAAPIEVLFVQKLLPRVQARLVARKRTLGLLDYDDMLLGVRDALAGPGGPVLLDALRKRWRFALVDEFQDTDGVQWEIFRRIFVDGDTGHRLFVIGDPKQAIYGFRGADVHTYEVAKVALVSECDAGRLVLPKNYRSTAPLIRAVNDILTFQDSAGRTFFDGINRYDRPVECGDPSREALEGDHPAVPVHLIHPHGGDVELAAAAIKRGLACFIAEEIRRLTAEGGLVTAAKGKGPSPVGYSDIYVLTRTGSESRAVGQVLRRYGIPHAFYKQEGLFQTEEALDIHKLLCAIDKPNEPPARMAAWLTPFFEVPLEELSSWRCAGESHPLVAMLLDWKEMAEAQSWARLFDEIVAGSGVARRLIFLGDERALTNYLHLFELLLAEAHSRPVTLSELARSLKARIDGRKPPEGREGDIQRLETDKDAVQLLTMHKAKGLEAEVVFIAGGFTDPPGGGGLQVYHQGNERRLHIDKPTGEVARLVQDEIREENQRLMYVALTRAKSRLYLPFFGGPPEGEEGSEGYGYGRLGSFYRPLQQRLDQMREAGRFAESSPFVLREADCRKRPPVEEDGAQEMRKHFDTELLEPPASSAPEAARIAPRHRGVLLTSYTRMSRGKSWQAPASDSDDRASRRDEEVSAEAEVGEGARVAGAAVIPDEGSETGDAAKSDRPELPRGRDAGIFLHALLEDTPSAEIAGTTAEEWSSREVVRARAAAAASCHGFGEEHLPEALRMVHAAFSTPVDVGSRALDGSSRDRGRREEAILHMPGGVATGLRQRAEMAFVYPIPERHHPLLLTDEGAEGHARGEDEATAALPSVKEPPYRAHRGYVQGLIDLVFEHEGKIFLLDWKSDLLPAFDQDTLHGHVLSNYALQARVYALAVLRLLGIRSEEAYDAGFGGVVYVFVRGIRRVEDRQEGVWFSRPAWRDIVLWERELMEREQWGGEVIQAAEAPVRERAGAAASSGGRGLAGAGGGGEPPADRPNDGGEGIG